jgi:hypothetical protein
MARSDGKKTLLEELTHLPGYLEGTDESKFASGFHPVPEHLKAFDPSVLLVLGNRGSGKSYLFQSVTKQGLAPDLRRLVPSARIPDRAFWINGFTNDGNKRPDSKHLIETFKKDGSVVQNFWLAALVRSLQDRLNPGQCQELLAFRGAQLSEWLRYTSENWETMVDALDVLDERLFGERETALIVYDELDTLIDDDPERSGHALTGLIAFWARFHRRWKALRPKLFLRTDLYRRFSTEGGADLAKLAANRVEIRWSDLALHGVLFKQILNLGNPEWGKFLGLKNVTVDKRFGTLLNIKSIRDVKPAYLALVGEYMGDGPRKGWTHRWPIEHVRDGLNGAHPRALVELFRKAADSQLKSGKLPERITPSKPGSSAIQTLLQPLHLRRALSEVSRTHVDSVSDVWSWMKDFKKLTNGRQTPADAEIWRGWIQHDIKKWPIHNSGKFLEELLAIGVLRIRSDGRIDASDLYLDGLGLKRRGGVQRKDKKFAKTESA